MTTDKTTSWAYCEAYATEDETAFRARERSLALRLDPVTPATAALLTVLASSARPGVESTRAHTVRLLVGTGLLGGFTTYSAFAEEMWQLVDGGDSAGAFGYAVVTLGAGLLAAAFGVLAGSALRDRPAAGRGDPAPALQRSSDAAGRATQDGGAP